MKPVSLAHVSDLHLPFEPALKPSQRLSKRQLSAWSWRRRGAIQRPEIVEALAADLRAQAPDHIVVTGDVTNFSLPAEFERAAAWLSALAPVERISLVPGNHDALVRVEPAQGIDRWARWTRLRDQTWPFVHRLPGDAVTLIGLNSALPTAPLLARGRLGSQQLQRLETILRDEGRAGRLRVLLLHHPVAVGAVRWRKALADAAALRALLARHGAELVLHGHARDSRFDLLEGPRGAIPCLCVPSSSALPNPRDEGARWNRLRLSQDAEGALAQVQVREWSVARNGFVDGAVRTLRLPSGPRG
ncbi:MAG: metallophosphoesterase [Panacagrimonas sp.]|nr:metallophosphoesterase [Panacagrimonas sp.]MCC2658534.1 metallophosphoesterase [Panacagrimonas sp.]